MRHFRRQSSRRGFGLRPVNSIKNIAYVETSITSTIRQDTLVKALANPASTNVTEVENGCSVKNIWISFDICGTGTSGTNNVFAAYMIKNPGANIVSPNPKTEGGSNEKKFIFKEWSAMVMSTADGNVPYHWEGWVKVPRQYQRMGTDDQIRFVCLITSTGHLALQTLYKWYK